MELTRGHFNLGVKYCNSMMNSLLVAMKVEPNYVYPAWPRYKEPITP